MALVKLPKPEWDLIKILLVKQSNKSKNSSLLMSQRRGELSMKPSTEPRLCWVLGCCCGTLVPVLVPVP